MTHDMVPGPRRPVTVYRAQVHFAGVPSMDAFLFFIAHFPPTALEKLRFSRRGASSSHLVLHFAADGEAEARARLNDAVAEMQKQGASFLLPHAPFSIYGSDTV